MKKEDELTGAKTSSLRQKLNKKKNQNTRIYVLILVVGLAIGLGVGALFFGGDSSKKDSQKDKADDKVSGTLEEMIRKDGFVIKTPVVDLYYPKKWEEKVRIEQVTGDIQMVQFFATLEGKPEIHLFDICFGGEEGYTLGYLNPDKRNPIAVKTISYDFDLSDEWTAEEENDIYGMLDDINYILGMLLKKADFEVVS